MFDLTRQVGGITIDRAKNIGDQLSAICEILVKKLAEWRLQPTIVEEPDPA
jgi:hypothetical protein